MNETKKDENNTWSTFSIPIQVLVENPLNKEIYNDRNLSELILDIKTNGLRQPLEVLEVIKGREYRIISGHSRYKAIKEILKENPDFPKTLNSVVYTSLTEEEEAVMLISSNSTQRERSVKEILKEIEYI